MIYFLNNSFLRIDILTSKFEEFIENGHQEIQESIENLSKSLTKILQSVGK